MSTTVRKYPSRRSRELRRAAGLAAALILGGGHAATAQTPSSPPNATGPPDVTQPDDGLPPLTERQERQLQILRVVLNPSDTIDSETRHHAAEELIAMRVPQAVAILVEGLDSEHPQVVRAVVLAMISCTEPPPGLLDPVVRTLRTAPREARDDLGKAVARYEATGLAAVVATATDAAIPVEERLGPIQALSSFQSRAAAEQLVDLLDPARNEPQAILDAACAALDRYNVRPNGNDPESWRRWWAQTRNQTQEQWLLTRIDRLSSRLQQFEAELAAERRRNALAEQRLQAAYRELFPSLAYEDQIRTLPKLLDDELDAVRRFAVGQIDRLLRDTVSIPLPLQEKLAERLADRLPEVRIQSAQLLDELAYDGVAERVAARLVQESDPQVASALLRLLAKRPTLTAIDSIRAAVPSPQTSAEAAGALWGLVRTVELPADQVEPTRDVAREALGGLAAGSAAIAPLTGVLAVIGDEQDIAAITPALDGEDAPLQRAVAEGFARRGLSEPLTARAGNEQIYPFAVQALATQARDLDTIRPLLLLAPPPAHQQGWADAVRRSTQTLDAAGVLAVDDILDSIDAATPELRRDLLERIVNLSSEAVAAEARAAVSIRLAPLLFELGQPVRAREMLQTLETTAPEPLRPQLFRAALECGAFDLAASLDGDPVAWIEVLESLVARRLPHAGTVRDEIARRFGDQLGEDVRRRFDAASAQVPTAAQPGTASEPGSLPPTRSASAEPTDEDG
ncbi:MAG: hypothetical protein ACYTJ0_17895 [Planctomycetota bacterium]|jgi:hypothetical protein